MYNVPNRVFVGKDFLITTQYLPSSPQAFRRNASQTRNRVLLAVAMTVRRK